jgi:hypothetical protein
MFPLANPGKAVACVLIYSLFVTGLMTLTTRQSHASNNSLPLSSTSTVKESSSAQNAPQARTVDEATQAHVSEAYGKLALRFEANQGQFDRQAQFLVRGGGYSLFLTPSEAVMVLTRPPTNQDKALHRKSPSSLQARTVMASRETREALARGSAKSIQSGAPQSAVLRMKLEGANPSAQVEALDQLPGTTNYFTGNDPRNWHTNIPSYARVSYREVYPGVDLLYYGRQQQLEYDLRVAPGVDPASIRLAFEGAQSIELDAGGDLVLHTAAGEVRQPKPLVYQEVEGARREVLSGYELRGEGRVGFRVEGYDRSKPLVIDPVLLYSTFLGGSSYDEGSSIAVDAAGNAYVTGFTYSYDFPVVNPVEEAGYTFVSKLNGDGSALIYSTFIGSTDYNTPNIAVDMEGCAYITGYTSSPYFPVVNAVQTTLGGGTDPFVTKLSPGGSALVYSTYLVGSNDEAGEGIAVDAGGNAYVTGYTYSNDFPVVNAFQATGAGNQAFKSTDGGGYWRVSDSGLNTVRRMYGLAIDPAHPSTLYAASDVGVFKSTNSGSTWQLTDSGADGTTFGGGLAVDPLNTSTIFFGTANGLLKSIDGGGTWANILQTGYNETVAVDPVHTSTIYASAYDSATNRYGAIFKSTDGGGHWRVTRITDSGGSPVEIYSLAVNPVNSSIVYAGGFYGGIYRSTNGGGSWHFLDDETTYLGVVTDLVINPLNPSIVYASGSGGPDYGGSGVYKSTDAGNHWQVVNNGLPPTYTYIDKLAIDPVHPSVLYAASLNGIYKTTDGGAHWDAARTGMTTKFARGIAIDPTATSKVYAVTDNWEDVFVTKLSPSGSTRLYSTFLGGTGMDEGKAIALDGEGNAYLTGWTYSGDFPEKNPIPMPYGNAFVTKLDATGSSLVYSTRLGGDNGSDAGYGIAVDASGNAYVTGETSSTNFPVTPGAFQTQFRGELKAFVTKINAEGTSLVYSTYLGGSYYESAYGIAVNSSGQAFVTGVTFSHDFPVANAIQSVFHREGDAFVTRLNPAGSALIFSTYLGGSGGDTGNAIAIDAASNAYVTGYTYSTNFPTTPRAFQRKMPDYVSAFVTKMGNPPASVRISGAVLLNGAGMAGATVTLKNGAGAVIQTATTPSNGGYSFNAPGGGDYTVTPTKPGYRFKPPSHSYTRVFADLPMQNFEAIRIITIQVQVQDINGNGLPGVKTVLRGSRFAICSTDANGLCSFTGLSVPGSYTVTPSQAGMTFIPTSKTFNNPSTDQLAIFKESFSISGRVTGAGGTGIGGVTIRLSGDSTTYRTTDSQGNYKFSSLPAGGHYIATPSKVGMTFNPAFVEINNLNAPTAADFQALVSITGKVRRTGTTSGISDVTMTLNGSLSATSTTSSGGIYTFSDLPAAGNYTVTPSKTGYTFNPPSRTYTNVRVSKGLSTSYFDGTPDP